MSTLPAARAAAETRRIFAGRPAVLIRPARPDSNP